MILFLKFVKAIDIYNISNKSFTQKRITNLSSQYTMFVFVFFLRVCIKIYGKL